MSSDNNFCSACGAAVQPGSAYCPRCGTAVGPYATGSSGQPMDWREQRRHWKAQRRAERYEKYEKGEKHEEKTEKGRGGGLVGSITGGAILIWLGITFYFQQIGYISSNVWWAYFIAGIGVIIIIQGLINHGRNRSPYVGSLIGGVILLLIGLAFILKIGANFWPLVLVIIGIAVLVSSLTARKRRPPPPTTT